MVPVDRREHAVSVAGGEGVRLGMDERRIHQEQRLSRRRGRQPLGRAVVRVGRIE